MHAEVQVDLPRESRSVGVLRAVSRCLLQTLEAPREAVEDVQVALSEACANVVRHAASGEAYRVRLRADEHGCEVVVLDRGPGFDSPGVGGSPTHPVWAVPGSGGPTGDGSVGGGPGGGGQGDRPSTDDASRSLPESGRGLALMRALVDDLQFSSVGDGTRVRLVKRWGRAA